MVWRVESPEVAPEVSDLATGQVTGQVRRLLSCMVAEQSRSELQALLGLKHRDSFIASYLQPALVAGWVEMTIPEKPRSGLQKYLQSQAGKTLVETWNSGERSE